MEESIVMESIVRSGQRIQAQFRLLLTQVLMTPVLIQALMKRKRTKDTMARKVGNMTTRRTEGMREEAKDLEKGSVLDPPPPLTLVQVLIQVLTIKENIMEKDLLESLTTRK